jgi:Domain of unknown function (DUF4276)
VNPFYLATIVEGHGEVRAFPRILQRIAQQIVPERVVITTKPVRLDSGKMTKADEVERAVRLAVLDIKTTGGIILLRDSDGACPATFGPQLLELAQQASGNVPIAAVLAHQEFEAWYIAAAESLCGYCGLPDNLTRPQDPENIGGAKGWLGERMPKNRKYSETVDQHDLAGVFDLEAARKNAPSFDKLWREMERLLGDTDS